MTPRLSVGAGRGIALGTLGNLAAPIGALVSSPILAHALDSSGRGELAAATAPLFLAASGLTFGLPESITFISAREPWRRKQVLLVGLALLTLVGGIGSVIILALAPALSAHDGKLSSLIALSGVALAPSLIVAAIRGLARGMMAWGYIAVEQILSSAMRLVPIVALSLGGRLTVSSAVVITVVSSVASAIVYLGLLKVPRSHYEPGQADSPPVGIVRFGLGMWVGGAAGIVLARFDQTVILPLSDARALGIYAVAVSICDVVRVFNKAVRDVMFAEQSARVDETRLALASRSSTILTLASGVSVVILAWFVVPFVFGEQFKDVTRIIAIILIGTVIGNPGSVVAAGLSARGRPLLRSLAMAGGVFINVILLFVLVPAWGADGAAWASAIANGITGWVVILLGKMTFDMNPLWYVSFRSSDLVSLVRSARRFVPGGQ